MTPDQRELRRLAERFLNEGALPIDTALDLRAVWDGDRLPASFAEAEAMLSLISSETDAIPVGERRALWHPDVRAKEDIKHDRAQLWARPMVEQVCRQLVAYLPSE